MAVPTQAPSMPATNAVSGKASETFNAMKGNLDSIASWGISPNGWDVIQIAYPAGAKETQARSFLKAIEIPMPAGGIVQ